jgi:SOS-response transcriptional repressor LexA
MKRLPLPATAEKVYGFILGFETDYGATPTRGEISKAFGFSRQSAEQHIRTLAKYGYIKLTNKPNRNIKIIEQ